MVRCTCGPSLGRAILTVLMEAEEPLLAREIVKRASAMMVRPASVGATLAKLKGLEEGMFLKADPFKTPWTRTYQLS